MKLERKAFLDAIDGVRPALAAKSMVEALSHIWFDGKTALAYNDSTLGIEVPFKSELKGGLRGHLLLAMLGASRAKEVEITAGEGEELLLKAGNTKLRLPLLPPKQAVWEFPETNPKEAIVLDKALLGAVNMVLVSTGDPEPSVPEKLGVTFEADVNYLDVFTTDSRTIAYATCPQPKGYSTKRVTIPTPFWEETLKRCKAGGKLWLQKDCVIAQATDGTRIFSKLVHVERPIDFSSAVESNLPPDWTKRKVPMPSRMALAVERGCILLEGSPNEAVKFAVDKDRLYMDAKVPFGELHDSMALDKPHEAVTVGLDPTLVKRGLGVCDSFMLTADCMVLSSGKNFIYLVSALV
jgi:hypothetical protein